MINEGNDNFEWNSLELDWKFLISMSAYSQYSGRCASVIANHLHAQQSAQMLHRGNMRYQKPSTIARLVGIHLSVSYKQQHGDTAVRFWFHCHCPTDPASAARLQ